MSDRTRIRRLPERGSNDPGLIWSIVDASPICHFGFVRNGYPVVIPTIHARVGETIYVHGSRASGNLRELKGGVDVCLTVTHLDGIIAARSLFHSSMRYRSAVLFGRSREVEDPDERSVAFEAITEHLIPGRWAEARQPSPLEDRQTIIIAIDVDEASAKVNDGWPVDEEDDYDLDVWAGVIPVSLRYGSPLADPRLSEGIAVPPHISNLSDEPYSEGGIGDDATVE